MATDADVRTGTRSPPLRLKVTEGNAPGTEIKVEDEFIIGRHADGEGKLANDAEISRQHARISRSDGGHVIEDLGSTNGTFVNGRRITHPEMLYVGDRITVGATTLVVQVSTKPSPTVTVDAGDPEAAPATQPEAAPAAEPAASPATDVAAPAPAAEASGPPPLSLRIEYGPEPGRARLHLGEGGEPIELVHGEGGWRIERG